MLCGLLTMSLIYNAVYGFSIKYSDTQNLCPVVVESQADIDTSERFPQLKFNPNVLDSTVSLWNSALEERFKLLYNTNKTRLELKVFAVPHSHNDPGWLFTFEQYYEQRTKQIIQNIVQKLEEFPNMTFVWNEISFLEKWWSQVKPNEQNTLKKLISEGRLEITTGGWVMPDEACTHIYSLLDQYIEGHEWLRLNLGIAPKTGWSIDPFGHGPTVPYLLEHSGIKGAVIQRIHYGWKQWFAEQTSEDFYWTTGWSKKRPSMLVHNMPMEIYSIKGSCGPHPSVCEKYDFVPVSKNLINELDTPLIADTLLKEYQRLGSLTPHNVVLVPLGRDFSYEEALEFDSKHNNYQKIFDYINSRKNKYNAHLQFGTPQDFFKEIEKRYELSKVPTLRGDFFPYADMFSSGIPQYWTGFYTTRPYTKILARKLEHHLRAAEILFSLVFNRINCRSSTFSSTKNKFIKFYMDLVSARRNLALFQHHDAITGTSKQYVMSDYNSKLVDSFARCLEIQEHILSMALIHESRRVLISDAKSYYKGKLQKKQDIIISSFGNKVVIFNSLSEDREVVVNIMVDEPNVKVYDNFWKKIVQHQIDPIIEMNNRKPVISVSKFDLAFIVDLPGLATVSYTISRNDNKSISTKVFCDHCASKDDIFKIIPMPTKDIILQNSIYKLEINKITGFMEHVYRKDTNSKHAVNIQFGAYKSAESDSGAYLFKPHRITPEIQVINTKPDAVYVTIGSISTKITVVYSSLILHELKIINSDNFDLARAIFMNNVIHLKETNTDIELFVRFNTDIKTEQVFYTDQNGFQYQKRVRVRKLGIEGNYYPITTMAWIQDNRTRLTYITDHAQGGSSFAPGRLELMLDRRIKYEDQRGMDEGVHDNTRTEFQNILVFDNIVPATKKYNEYELPSKIAGYFSRNLNYPLNVYYVNSSVSKNMTLQPYMRFAELPNNLHLMSLRTITRNDLPSHSCYMVVQRPGFSCRTSHKVKQYSNVTTFKFNRIKIRNITSVSLTGLQDYSKVSELGKITLDPMEIKTYRLDLFSNPSCVKQNK